MTTHLGADFNTSACRERGKAKLTSIEEACENMLLIPPPDLVAMWGQMEDSEDCCGFIATKRNATHWQVARHGSLQLNTEKLQIRETEQGAHLSVVMHRCEMHAADPSA